MLLLVLLLLLLLMPMLQYAFCDAESKDPSKYEERMDAMVREVRCFFSVFGRVAPVTCESLPSW